MPTSQSEGWSPPLLLMSQLSEGVLEQEADTGLDSCLHSIHTHGFHPLDNDSGSREPYMKPEKFRGLDSTSLAHPDFQERKPDRHC